MAVLSLLGAGGRVTAAQSPTGNPARSAVAFALVQTRPVGALGDNIGAGYGLAGAYLLPLDRRGMLSLRADLGGAEYGHETRRTAFSESVGGRVEVNARTANTLAYGSIGLQLTVPVGPIMPYVNGGIGAQAFYTESGVMPIGGGPALASTVNQFDAAPAWTVGGGVYVPLSLGRLNFMLDVGAQYVHGGTAEYLGTGSIVDLPDGQITIATMESSTRMLAVRVGARIGL